MSLNLEQTTWYSPWENCFAEPFCVIPGKLTWFCLPSYKHKSQKKFKSEVIMAVTMKITLFQDMALRSPIPVYGRFRGSCYLQFLGTLWYSEMSIYFHHTILCRNPGNKILIRTITVFAWQQNQLLSPIYYWKINSHKL